MFVESCELLQRLELQAKLDFHTGCVNTIAWNEGGTRLLSGSDDHTLVISNPDNFTKHSVIYTPHTANIFSAKFVPGSGDRKLVSCAGDGHIVYTDVCKQPESSSFHCHTGTVYDVVCIPGDSHTFLSCGEDGTIRAGLDIFQPPPLTKNRVVYSSLKLDILPNIHFFTLDFLPPILKPFTSSPPDIVLNRLKIKKKNVSIPLSLFFSIIFFPTALIFPSQLYKFMFFPNRLDTLFTHWHFGWLREVFFSK